MNGNQSNLRVLSADCHLCDCGLLTNLLNEDDTPLYTGDIVQLWEGKYLETDLEVWVPIQGLTTIVCNQYKSFSDGTVVENADKGEFFAMGIKNANMAEWMIFRVKSFRDVIAGEHWPKFGFSYMEVEG